MEHEHECEICDEKINSVEEQYCCQECGKAVCWMCIGTSLLLCNECEEDKKEKGRN